MGKNNICVIYDSDESYAKRLMSVINDDNDIPYNAQVFTKENDLDRKSTRLNSSHDRQSRMPSSA